MPRTGRCPVLTRCALAALSGVLLVSCARIGKPFHSERRATLAPGWPRPTSETGVARHLPEYATVGPRSVVELQPYRESRSIRLPGGGTATLVNLNPNVNAWFLLRLAQADDSGTTDYHLESADTSQRLQLDPGYGSGLVPASALSQALRSGQSFAALCGDRLFLRLATRGRRTKEEWAADFLRDHVWRGDAITGFVKDGLFRDAARNVRAADGCRRARKDRRGPTGRPRRSAFRGISPRSLRARSAC